jgi:hypothetical protein
MRLRGLDLVGERGDQPLGGAVSGRDRSELDPQRPKLT